MCAEWVETTRLGLGAFLTSPGAGILGLVGAAWLTLVGVGKRLEGDREIAQKQREAEMERHSIDFRRERWQWAYDHLWENRQELSPGALRTGLAELRSVVETKQQSAMLEVFASALVKEAEEGA